MNPHQSTFIARHHIPLLAAAVFLVLGVTQLLLPPRGSGLGPGRADLVFLGTGTPLLGLMHASLVALATEGPSVPRKLGFIALSGLAQMGAFVIFLVAVTILGDSSFVPVLLASLAGCIMYLGIMFLVLRLPIVGRTIGLGCLFSSLWFVGFSFVEPIWVFAVEPFVWWVGVSTSLVLTMPKRA